MPETSESVGPGRKFLLVLLRRSAAQLNAETLEAAARSAWERRFGRNPDGSYFVESGEQGAGFILQAHGNAFLVMELPKGVRELAPPWRFHPPTATNIWSEYGHDLSVSVAYNYDTDTHRLCAFVGSLALALADAETLAVVHPDSRQLWQLDHATIERLDSRPELFFETSRR